MPFLSNGAIDTLSERMLPLTILVVIIINPLAKRTHLVGQRQPHGPPHQPPQTTDVARGRIVLK
jgi:hypothetical protein